MPLHPRTDLDADVARALSALGAETSEPALDAVAVPGAVAAALDRLPPSAPFLLRAAPPLGSASSRHGPEPEAPVWIRGTLGGADVRIAPLRLAEGERPTAGRVARLVVTAEERPCCDAPACTNRRTLAAAWVELERTDAEATPRRLLVAAVVDLDGDRARARVVRAATPLARAFAAPLEAAEGALPPPAEPEPQPEGPVLPAGKLARFALRPEGERLVLRDHDSRGPRTNARRDTVLGTILLAVSLALWLQAARAFRAGDRNLTIGFTAAAALVTLSGYAFVSVARFGARYRALSAPLFWAGRDRFVIAPWVSRTGAVDLLPEGRLGAAIAMEEVRGVSTPRRDDLVAVEIDSDHGPMDVFLTDDAALASFWAAALRRALGDMAHPGTRASARKRARERAAGEAPAAAALKEVTR
ncbi:hypothetical protein [Polyangium jinanense]|uniref:Uncharacterized protein n=1 Tax=Polyangium jinanense TaxID=2829994 RepID=A0A9X3XAC0_9BACT|nr:hypothetical protein [Polyangium jinanense]MDC3956642.1 hypothetical protein [Polyangium jinanense]MDC3985575.1 hypothetical protein [Polyangium jinanense]